MGVQQILRYPEVNGAMCSFASIELKGIGALPIQAIKSIGYKDTVTLGSVRGTNANRIGRTRGTVDCSGEIEFYKNQFDAILPLLAAGGAAGGKISMGYGEGSYPLTVTYAEASMPNLTKTDVLLGVRFLDADNTHSEGAEALTVKMKLDIMRINWHLLISALR